MDSNVDKVDFPDVYLRQAKHKFGYAANAHPYEFKVLLEVMNEFIHYKDQLSETAFFNLFSSGL